MSSEARDARLVALRDAVEEWADREEERLNAEKTFLEAIQGRSSSGELSSGTTEIASVLLQNEVDEFLSE
jgi:hypothetical protein